MIRILLVDDHTLVRKALTRLLRGDDDIAVVGEADSGRQALEMAASIKPDVVVMDIAMQGLNGIDAARAIHKEHPSIAILALTSFADEEFIAKMMRAGASGYMVKDCEPDELARGIRAVASKETYLCPRSAQLVVKAIAGKEAVTSRQLNDGETKLLQMIADGIPSRDMAQALEVSVKTVENRRSNLMKKLDLHSIADLTKYAIKKGISNL